VALYWRSAKPELYKRIGSTVFDGDVTDDEPAKQTPEPV